MSLRNELCQQIREYCKAEKISGYRIAKNTGISKSTASGMLRDDGPTPRLDTIEKVVEYLKIDFAVYIGREHPDHNYSMPPYVLIEIDQIWDEANEEERERLLYFIRGFKKH